MNYLYYKKNKINESKKHLNGIIFSFCGYDNNFSIHRKSYVIDKIYAKQDEIIINLKNNKIVGDYYHPVKLYGTFLDEYGNQLENGILDTKENYKIIEKGEHDEIGDIRII